MCFRSTLSEFTLRGPGNFTIPIELEFNCTVLWAMYANAAVAMLVAKVAGWQMCSDTFFREGFHAAGVPFSASVSEF